MKLLRFDLWITASLFALSRCAGSAAGTVPSIAIGQNFTGSTYGVNSSATPPDSDGAIGPGYFVEFINGTFAVYSKTNGQNVKRVSDLIFWSRAGVALSSSQGVSDPRIVYDPTVQRWFASMVDFDANAPVDPSLESNDFLLAVSATSDPKGAWHGFIFQADPDTGYFADFPTLGVDGNAVYLSGDMYQGQDNPLGAALWSFPKADLLAATPSIANATWFGVMAYSQRGDVLQPVNCFDGLANGKVLSVTDIGNDSDPHSNLVSFAVQNAGGPGATLSAATFIPTPPWTVPYNDLLTAPAFTVSQPDATQTLDGNDARFSARVCAVNDILYAVHHLEVNNRLALRWYRIRAADNIVLEFGTIADPNSDLFFPSIAANPYGVVVIAFNGSGLASAVSCYAMAGQTVNGQTSFGSRILLQSGATSYHDLNEQIGILTDAPTLSRWGDYSTTSMDPSDPNRFWTIQMFPSDAANDYVWSTQITELVTTPLVSLTIQQAGANVSVSWPSAFADYHLQSKTNLAASTLWANVSPNPVTNGTQLVVTVPATGASRFFRLQKP